MRDLEWIGNKTRYRRWIIHRRLGLNNELSYVIRSPDERFKATFRSLERAIYYIDNYE